MTRLNVGCGATPTPGWINYDNSLCVRLVAMPWAARLLSSFGLLHEHQREFIKVAKRMGIRWANVATRIPEPDGSAEVLYTSHMLDFLTQRQRERFLREVRRVLMPGGIIRVAVADLRCFVDRYLQDNDCDLLIRSTGLPMEYGENINTFLQRLQYALRFILLGHRLHRQWMYDGESLCELLKSAGFQESRIVPLGETTIPEPGALDLHERGSESVYVEAINSVGSILPEVSPNRPLENARNQGPALD